MNQHGANHFRATVQVEPLERKGSKHVACMSIDNDRVSSWQNHLPVPNPGAGEPTRVIPDLLARAIVDAAGCSVLDVLHHQNGAGAALRYWKESCLDPPQLLEARAVQFDENLSSIAYVDCFVAQQKGRPNRIK